MRTPGGGPLHVSPLEVVDGGGGPGAGAVGRQLDRGGQGGGVEEVVHLLLVVAGALQVGQLGEDFRQESGVVFGKVVGAVVDDDDLRRRVVVHV
ncbi:hypothetical protein [Streptomyces sp. NPDC048442]|uniref:hypothetical protein n=1 Tax=Streptomyces sp. NPDC048442 TaxID=3154823 RepID=UPI003421D27E